MNRGEGLLRPSHVGVGVLFMVMNLCSTTSHAHLHPRLPLRMAARHVPFSHNHRAFVVGLPRGGESVAATLDDEDEEEELLDLDNLLSESEEEEEELDDETEEELEEEMVEEEEDEEEEEEEEEEGPVVSSNNDPMRVVVQTGLLWSSESAEEEDEGSAQRLLDETLELTCLKSRTVASIQQTLARQLKGRPPATLIQLLHEGRVLSPDETLLELLQDAQEDEDEEEEEDEDNNDLKSIHLTLDMVPPVGPKFATEWKDLLPRISNSDLLDAYAANLAALHWNSRFLLEHDDETSDETSSASAAKVVAMRQHALRIRDQLRNNYVSSQTDNESKWLEALAPALEAEQQQQQQQQEGQSGTIMASRRRKAGGAKMNVKRVLQRNLNIVSIIPSQIIEWGHVCHQQAEPFLSTLAKQ
eukprot:scaffold13562_cov44-Attheya_sp.AAC.3